jgi:hypothetical protein
VERLGAPQLPHAEIRHPRVADLAALDQSGHGLPRLLDTGIWVRPVDLVEVDRLDPEPFLAVVRLLLDARGRESVGDPALRGIVPDQTALVAITISSRRPRIACPTSVSACPRP